MLVYQTEASSIKEHFSAMKMEMKMKNDRGL
jgi:hypothetical protein